MTFAGEICRADSGFFFVFAFFVIIAIVVILGLLASHKRKKALHALAVRKGLAFAAHDAFNLPNVYGQTKLCSTGHSRKAKNVIYGDMGEGEVRYFDYRYTTGSGRNSHTYHFGACAFHIDCHLAALVVRREGLFDKVAGFFGFDDIDLDHGEFNRRFYVSCSDKKFAYDVLSQRAMQFFLDRRWLSMEMRWNYLVFYRSGRPKVAEVERLIEDAAAFAEALPNYLKEERAMHSARGSGAPAGRGAAADAGESGYTFDGIEPDGKRSRR